MQNTGTKSCLKCGLEVEEDIAICPACDFIIDTSFLGEDILDESRALSGDCREENKKHLVGQSIKNRPTASAKKKKRSRKKAQEINEKNQLPALPKQPIFADEDDEFSEISKSVAASSKKKKALSIKPRQEADFGEDAIILGGDEDEFSSFAAEHSGMHREVTHARIYVGGKTSELLRNDAILKKSSGLRNRQLILTPYEEHALSFINGKRPVGRIRRKSGMLETELKLALAMLADKGVIQLKGHITAAQKERARLRRIKRNAERNASVKKSGTASEKDSSLTANAQRVPQKQSKNGPQKSSLALGVTALFAEPISVENMPPAGDDVFAEGDVGVENNKELRTLGQEASRSFKKRVDEKKEAVAEQSRREAGFDNEKDCESNPEHEPTVPIAQNTAEAKNVFVKERSESADDVLGEISLDFIDKGSLGEAEFVENSLPAREADAFLDATEQHLAEGVLHDLSTEQLSKEPQPKESLVDEKEKAPKQAEGEIEDAHSAFEKNVAIAERAPPPELRISQGPSVDKDLLGVQEESIFSKEGCEKIAPALSIRPAAAPNSAVKKEADELDAPEYDDEEYEDDTGTGFNRRENIQGPVTHAARRKSRLLFDEAKSSARKGNSAAALMSARLALIHDPQNEEVQRAIRAWERVKPGESQKAPEVLLFEEAQFEEGKGNFKKALELLDDALAIAPQAAALHNRRAVILATGLKQYGDASKAILKACELAPDNFAYKNNLGKILVMEERHRESAGEKRGFLARVLGRKGEDDDNAIRIKKLRPKMF